MKVVIIGYGEMFVNLIAGVLDASCEICGILRKDTVKYPLFIRKLKDIINPSMEYNYIKSYSLPEIHAAGVNTPQFKKALLKLNPDIILVGSWGEKIEKEIFDLPKIAAINAHPSLLPAYRGPNPYFWTIRNGEQASGITLHLLDENLDTGAILAQEEIKIFPSDTGKTLKERTVLTARGVVCELLKTLREDIIIPLQQTEDKSSYYSHPHDLMLDFRKSAVENSALIRACFPWCEAYFYYDKTLLAAHPASLDIRDNTSEYTPPGTITDTDYKNKTISVLCGDNKILTFRISLYEKYKRLYSGYFIKHKIAKGSECGRQLI